MKYTIKNDYLTVTADTFGAELCSIKSADGTEYLWQGDPKFWKGQAPNLFPYIARLTDGTYTFNGKSYQMKIHGFLKYMELQVEEEKEDSITFRLDSNEETLQQFPFTFSYLLTYSLEKNKLMITCRVENRTEERMFFAVGGHPGFHVPMEEGLEFEDYVLEFSKPAHPSKVEFTDDCHVNGEQPLYKLEDDVRIPLHHDLFDRDAIVLKNADRCVTIRSDKGTRAVKVSYPDFAHIGFWHMPKTTAPYVCVEPWSSLPSRAGVVEDFAQQSDLIALDGKKTYENVWTIEII